MEIPFALQSYQSDSLPVSAQRVQNMYVEAQPQGAKGPAVLKPTPGLAKFVDLGAGPVQALHVMAGTLYAVANGVLYSVNATGSAVSTIGTTGQTGRVVMADNGSQLVMVDGASGWIYSTSGGLAQITDVDFYPARTCAFQDSYIIFERKGTGQFFWSALLDAADYDALDFATAEGSPDDTVAVLSDHRELWLFGAKTIEVWYNSGAPWERIPGAFIERGCIAPYSAVKMDNTVFWLADDRTVRRADGYTPVRISTHAIEAAIEKYGTIEDAFGYAYTDRGHAFYVLTFPEEDITWVYDASTNMWHERKSATVGRHRGNCYAYAYRRHLAGDFSSGIIWQMSQEAHREGTNLITRLVTSPTIHAEQDPLFMSRLQIEFEPGVGTTTGLGSDPTAYLEWSDDRGKTWNGPRAASIGEIGTNVRAKWDVLGSFRNRIYRVSVAEPTRVVIMSAYGDVSRGSG